MKSSQFVEIQKSKDNINAEIKLTGSKSESNRALIMQNLANNSFEILNLSKAEDTITLKNILNTELNTKAIINVGPAGTAMRFLTALLSISSNEYVLTGTHRMLDRPISILVDAIVSLGGKIEYLDKIGYPPLKIIGSNLDKSSVVEIDGSVSSQYISALLMIAPLLPNGLKIILKNKISSRPYIEMTLMMMQELGIVYQWDRNEIIIAKQSYIPKQLYIEPDWSAASYWAAMVALSDNLEVKLVGLKENSRQGDKVLINIITHFGVECRFVEDGLIMKTNRELLNLPSSINFEDCPDLAQTFAVICAALKHNCKFLGLESLKIKETDRVLALQNELKKINVDFINNVNSYDIVCNDNSCLFEDKLFINTYDDHRMAMAFAPLVQKINKINIQNPDVTSKSYPNFWKDLELIGLKIK